MNPNWPDVVGICGQAQHGKDTIGKMLVDVGYVRVSFAEPVYACALAINPWVDVPENEWTMHMLGHYVRLSDVVQHYGWERAKKFPEIRRILQVVGTEAGRNVIGETVWIDIALRKIKALKAQGKKAAVTDVRFPDSEDKALILEGAILLKAIRPDFDNGVDSSHPSESGCALIQADYDLMNNGNLAELHAIVMEALNDNSGSRLLRNESGDPKTLWAKCVGTQASD